MAHPELIGNYVQPFTLEERLTQTRQCEKELGATIPWLVDAMDNRLMRALGDRPNSEFIVDPKGIIVSKRAWSYPAQVRRDLEKWVGSVAKITRAEDIKLKIVPPIKAPAARGVLPRLVRPRMQPIELEPLIDPKGPPFYAKLRAEADNALLIHGAGRLYLGFHLDPLHRAHWNNLVKPLSFRLDVPDRVEMDELAGTAPKVKVAADADPREFMLNVKAWPRGKPVHLTVSYFACVGEEICDAVRQQYVLHLKPDYEAGVARGEGAGYWGREFVQHALTFDRNGDGKLSKSEVQGLILPHFKYFDKNRDGFLDPEELKAVTDWLNHRHQAGPAGDLWQEKPGNSIGKGVKE